MITEDAYIDTEKTVVHKRSKTKPGLNLNKEEREDLFLRAEQLYQAGDVKTSVAFYLQCLQNLEVKSAFTSLPKCLRALANHFLQEKDFDKSVHFIQAERLYYESALLDTASFQRRINELTNDRYAEFSEIDDSENLTLQIREDNKQERMLEYEHLFKYFQLTNQLDLSIMYGEKCLNLKEDLYGVQHNCSIQMKEQLNQIKQFNSPENQRINGLSSVNYQSILPHQLSSPQIIFEKSLELNRKVAEPAISESKSNIQALLNFKKLEMVNNPFKLILFILGIIFTVLFIGFILLSIINATRVTPFSLFSTRTHDEVAMVPVHESLNQVSDTETEENALDTIIRPIVKTYNDIKFFLTFDKKK